MNQPVLGSAKLLFDPAVNSALCGSTVRDPRHLSKLRHCKQPVLLAPSPLIVARDKKGGRGAGPLAPGGLAGPLAPRGPARTFTNVINKNDPEQEGTPRHAQQHLGARHEPAEALKLQKARSKSRTTSTREARGTNSRFTLGPSETSPRKHHRLRTHTQLRHARSHARFPGCSHTSQTPTNLCHSSPLADHSQSISCHSCATPRPRSCKLAHCPPRCVSHTSNYTVSCR